MKYRTPPHCSVVAHGGATMVVAPDGSIEAPEADAALLFAHGITPWACVAPLPPASRQPSDREIETMPRGVLLAALAKLGRAASPAAGTAELRRALRRALAARV